MAETYPIMLQIEGKKAVVIGGGTVALRKIRRLLDSRACVTVISPDVSTEIHQLYMDGALEWKQKIFEAVDMENALLVMAASSDPDVNQMAAEFAKPYQLVNIADDPHAGNFHVPASFNRGKLSISVATGGASPILAKKIRNELSEKYGEEFNSYLEFLDISRKKIHASELDKTLKKALLEETVSEAYMKSSQKQQSLLFYLHLLSFTAPKSLIEDNSVHNSIGQTI